MTYQWDALLLEAGFLTIFLGSSTLIRQALPLAAYFGLVLLSGAVKLLSHDPAWHNFHRSSRPLRNTAPPHTCGLVLLPISSNLSARVGGIRSSSSNS